MIYQVIRTHVIGGMSVCRSLREFGLAIPTPSGALVDWTPVWSELGCAASKAYPPSGTHESVKASLTII